MITENTCIYLNYKIKINNYIIIAIILVHCEKKQNNLINAVNKII